MKDKLRVGILSSVITLVVCLALFAGVAYAVVRNIKLPDGALLSYLDYLMGVESIYEFDEKAALEAMYSAYLSGGLNDRYAEYYDEESFEELIEENSGNFVGIGVMITGEARLNKGLSIVRVLGNGPAEKAGLKAGDILLGFDDVLIDGMTYDEATDLIKAEEGTTRTFLVERDGETFSVQITYQAFTIREIEYAVYDGIGFIRIHQFTTAAFSQFEQALIALEQENIKGLIIDLRNNPGGMLSTVTNMLDLLLPQGERIVTVAYKGGEENYTSSSKPILSVPVSILVNGSSASASELFSSACRDVLGATLVGEKTFGKGIGQTILPLAVGGGIKLTTFSYYTKSGTNFDGVGLIPDETVALSEEKEKRFYSLDLETEDDQFIKAKEMMTNLINGGAN